MKHVWLVLMLCSSLLWAVTKVGNGDEGSDLEGASHVTAGKLVEARDKALLRMERLNTAGISGLGRLQSELKGAAIYLAAKDTRALIASDQGTFHANLNGLVFARTFCEPLAPTRFFPVALDLNMDQLVALHVHEALHRSLPADLRENEAVVTDITLALTSPEATHDRAQATMQRYLPGAGEISEKAIERYPTPNSLGYGIRHYMGQSDLAYYPIRRLHVFHSYLYPLGSHNSVLGLGIEGGFVERESEFLPGPLGISARVRVWTVKGFDVSLIGKAALNMLSADEIKNSPYGRDVFTAGISLLREQEHYYIENILGIDSGGTSRQTVGSIEYQFDYGKVFHVQVRGGARFSQFQVGGFIQIHLADEMGVRGGAYSKSIGRYRLISGGPEVSYKTDAVQLSAQARVIFGGTKDANFDYLGNLLGPGLAQGGVGVQAAFLF